VIARLKRYVGLHVSNLAAAAGRIVTHPGGTLLTVMVIAIALALPAGLRVIVNNLSALGASWESAADFTVYLKLDVAEKRARELAAEIRGRGDVSEVFFVGKDAALEEFRAQSGFGDALDALGENPLPNALTVRPARRSLDEVEALAASLEDLPETELVQVDTEWVERLQSMLTLAGRLVDIAAALLALAVVLVIGNTIRLEINNRRTEIEVMKLVGGSDGFIRRPFLYLGFCYGLAGALLAVALIGIALALIRAPVRELSALYSSDFGLSGLTLGDVAYLVAGGGLLGWAGAWVAAARRLRSIEPV
jgi:cell division transport system permease protein